jgi:hypothetical protein
MDGAGKKVTKTAIDQRTVDVWRKNMSGGREAQRDARRGMADNSMPDIQMRDTACLLSAVFKRAV